MDLETTKPTPIEVPRADPVAIVERKIDALFDLVRSNASASLAAHEEHRKAFAEIRSDYEDLRGKVERGTASRPPLTVVAREASRQASNATLEVAAAEGRMMAAIAAVEAKAEAIEAKTDAQTEMLATIAKAVTTVTTSPTAIRVAKAIGLLLLGYAASKGIHL